jgi:hypothetical protein
MGCDNNCKKDQCNEKCNKKDCCLPCCAPDNCDKYSAYEICCKKRAAVVNISSQLATVVKGLTTVPASNAEISYLRLNGNGAFIMLCGRRYILTTSALVIAAPGLLANADRYPVSGVENADASGAAHDIVAFSKILVSVHNLNGRVKPSKKSEDGHTIVYEASPAFVDGAGGWALLYIDPCKEWNRCLPKIEECHPFFEIGKSRQLYCGDDLYLLGSFPGAMRMDMNRMTTFGITKGVVSNSRGLDRGGCLLPELIIGDFEAFSTSMGMPIVNKFGQLVGVQLTSTPGLSDVAFDIMTSQANPTMPTAPFLGQGFVSGVSSYFFSYGLKVFSVIGSRKQKYDCFRRHLATVMDRYHGDYYKYVKGFIGISFQYLEAEDYNTRLADGNLMSLGRRVSLLQDVTTGGLYDGPLCKNLAGVRVVHVAGNAGTTFTSNGTPIGYGIVPGSPTNPAGAPYAAIAPFDVTPGVHQDSNFINSLTPETIITAGERCYFGDQSHQIPISLLTWKYIAGDRISFVVRRPNYSAPLVPTEQHLRDSNAVSGQLQTFPPTYDYPWPLIGYYPLPLVQGAVQVAPPLGVGFPPSMAFYFKPAL